MDARTEFAVKHRLASASKHTGRDFQMQSRFHTVSRPPHPPPCLRNDPKVCQLFCVPSDSAKHSETLKQLSVNLIYSINEEHIYDFVSSWQSSLSFVFCFTVAIINIFFNNINVLNDCNVRGVACSDEPAENYHQSLQLFSALQSFIILTHC